MEGQYTVNVPDSPRRAAAIGGHVADIKRLAMTPEASTLNGDSAHPYVKVQWGSVPGIQASFPVVSAEHAQRIVDAINEPWKDQP